MLAKRESNLISVDLGLQTLPPADPWPWRRIKNSSPAIGIWHEALCKIRKVEDPDHSCLLLANHPHTRLATLISLTS